MMQRIVPVKNRALLIDIWLIIIINSKLREQNLIFVLRKGAGEFLLRFFR